MSTIRISIDLWNGYIKWMVINNEDDRDIIISKQIIKTEWYRKGKILNEEVFASSINNLVEGFQKKLWGEYVDDIIVGVSHPELRIKRLSEHKRILWWAAIQHADTNHLHKLIREISQENNYEIVTIIPAYRLLDDEKIEKNPIGSEAKKLTMIADIFYLPKVFYQQLFDIFHSINLNVIDIVPNILSWSDYLLDIDHKDLWSVLIDIGANQTSYAIFENWHALAYGCLPIGWDEVSKDLSIWLQIDIKQAESIKTQYKNLEKNDGEMRLDHKFLHEIVEARYEQIFEKINDKLKKLDRHGRLAWWIHLTGQWSLWPQTITYARDIFQLAVFTAQWGKEYNDVSQDLAFQNALSLYERAKKYHSKNKWFFSMRKLQWFGSSGKWFFDSVGNFFKDLF